MPLHPPSSSVPVLGKKAVGFGVVVLLHGVFFWALNAGLGRKLLESPAIVVFTELVSEVRANAVPPSMPPVPPKAAEPPKTATVPAPTPVVMRPTAAVEPTPLAATPTQAIAAPSPAPSVAAHAAAPVLAPAPVAAAPVRVAANLQASGSCLKPEYPALSRRKEEQGAVVLRLLIGVDGNVQESQVAQSSGSPRLDEAARAALAKCQFRPGTVDGKPEASWASLKYTWVLD